MNLAVILGVCWLSLGSPQNATPSQPQTPPSQNAEPTQSAPAPTGQAPTSPAQTKPSPNRPRHHKKAVPPNCSNAPTATNPTAGAPADSTNSTGDGGSAGSTEAGPTESGSAKPGSGNAGATALPPCPPPKKVVRNGGSDEPAVQLTGGTPAEQSVHQRSTEELTFATEENLKRIAGRQLSPGQQEMVNQINQFLDQSKTAVAAGDLERGHNLALKAHLLSDELVKP